MSPWAASARSAKASHACAAPATNARPPSQRRGTISRRCCRVASIRFYSPAAYFPILSSPAAGPSRNRQSAQARGIAGARRRLICFAPCRPVTMWRAAAARRRPDPAAQSAARGRSGLCPRRRSSRRHLQRSAQAPLPDRKCRLRRFRSRRPCVALLAQRKELSAGALQQYVEMLRRLERRILIGARLTRECPGRAERGLLRARNETRAPALAREGRALGRDTRPRSNAVLLRCTKMRAGMRSGHFLAPDRAAAKWPVRSSRWHCRRGDPTISVAANR
jgi:hypothetical protein